MIKRNFSLAIIFLFFCTSYFASAQKSSLNYTVSMENPALHYFQVELKCNGIKKEFIDFKMPVWTPGYYQKLDFAKNVESFKAFNSAGEELKWEKTTDNTWRVFSKNNQPISLTYKIKTIRPFVATPYLDETRGYIIPTGVLFYIDKMIKHSVQVTIIPTSDWGQVATGLDSVSGKKFTYTAPDFDILYDSPLLVGNLEELPAFKVAGITHRFIGLKPGDFDRAQFMEDLKKIVSTSVKTIGDIPYKNYTFIAIGPGAGGIEHLNNTTFGFNGSGLNKKENHIRVLHFLAHEYFHHYNVKRIRPIELGPFDYDNGNKTKMLWLSEGISVYYEYMMVKRAGLSTEEDLFNAFRNNMLAFENKPGRLYQTLEQSSYETWSDGPFGRTGDEVNKTISYYDKGPVVGLLLDFKIRELTKNKKSLDDVMRFLYKEYYQKKKRGFTDKELRQAFELIAGQSLAEEFDYITTTKELDYPKYFSYAGLSIDTTTKEIPGAYTGLTTRERNDSIFIAAVDFESPAWNEGIRARQQLVQLNGSKATAQLFKETMDQAKPGDKLNLTILINNNIKEIEIKFSTKKQKMFIISPVESPGVLQKKIFESWLKG